MAEIDKLRFSLDSNDMFGMIAAMPDHLRDGAQRATDADLHRLESETFHSVVFAGMGGSAIGGEMVRNYLLRGLPVPFAVNRNYGLPGYVNRRSLVVCSSYSGNTEETLSSYKDAVTRGANVIALTSGGELEKRAGSDRVPVVKIPGGLPPRAALGYSFASLLIILFRLGLCLDPMEDLDSAGEALRAGLESYLPENAGNPALDLARKIHGTIPLIYAGQDNLDCVATRFKCQICENAKQAAFSNAFPEANHNEIEGWERIFASQDEFSAIMIRSGNDHPRIRARMEVAESLMKEKGAAIHEIHADSSDELPALFKLIQHLDFTSYYLALLNNVDPTPVEAIESLKRKMSEWR